MSTGVALAPTTAAAAASRPTASMQAWRAARAEARRRGSVVLALLLVLWAGVFVARVLLGDFTITVPDALRILGGADIPGASFILMESKLPRAVAGTLAGLALGASGATFQTMAHNPLASPDVLGITMGASAAAVFTLVVLGLDGSAVALAALIGAAAVAVALVALSGTRPGGATYRMILIGIAISAMLTSVIHWIIVRGDLHAVQDAMVWLSGNLTSVTWTEIVRLAVVVGAGVPLVLLLARRLHLVALGDELAHGLGAPPARVRVQALALVVVLTAVVASVCGPIAFVSLLAGPIARRMLGGRAGIGAAALVGAVIVVGADYLAAYALPDVTLPVGVVTGITGAPFLLWLLVGQGSRSRGGAA